MVYSTVGPLQLMDNFLTCRLGLVLIGLLLGVILLADVSFQTSYIPSTTKQFVKGGLGPFNTTLLSSHSDDLPVTVFANIRGLLTDSSRVSSTPSTISYCQGASSPVECWTVLLLGGLDFLIPEPVGASAEETMGGTSYVVESVSAYSLEYFPIQNGEIILEDSDCTTYRAPPSIALEVCIKNINDDLMIGKSPFGDFPHVRVDGLQLR